MKIAIALILLIGIAAGVFLVQRQQTLKSRANQEIQNAFEFTADEPDKNVERRDQATFDSNTLNIKIKLNDLEAVSNLEQ